MKIAESLSFLWRKKTLTGFVVFSDEYQQKFADELFGGLLKMLEHIKVSACGRDAAMELLIKNVTRKTGVYWTKQFLDTEGQ